MSAPTHHPSSDWGPPMAAINRGIVMNGPIPTMLAMLRAVASRRPKPRVSFGSAGPAGGLESMVLVPRFVGGGRRVFQPGGRVQAVSLAIPCSGAGVSVSSGRDSMERGRALTLRPAAEVGAGDAGHLRRLNLQRVLAVVMSQPSPFTRAELI